jgi:hypothetical protein
MTPSYFRYHLNIQRDTSLKKSKLGIISIKKYTNNIKFSPTIFVASALPARTQPKNGIRNNECFAIHLYAYGPAK